MISRVFQRKILCALGSYFHRLIPHWRYYAIEVNIGSDNGRVNKYFSEPRIYKISAELLPK